MLTVDALKELYTALGGTEDLSSADTIVDVLNAISAKYEGDSDAILNPQAIENITAVADNIGGGGSSDFSTAEVRLINTNLMEYSVVPVPVIIPIEFGIEGITTFNITETPSNDYTFIVPLYKGANYITWDGGVPNYISISGNAEIYEWGVLPTIKITGDCIIENTQI